MTPYFSVAQKCSRICGARPYGFQEFFFSLLNSYSFMALPKSTYLPRLSDFFFLIKRPQTAPNVVILPDLIVRAHKQFSSMDLIKAIFFQEISKQICSTEAKKIAWKRRETKRFLNSIFCDSQHLFTTKGRSSLPAVRITELQIYIL